MTANDSSKQLRPLLSRTFTSFLSGFRNIGLVISVFFTLISSAFLFGVGVYNGVLAMKGFLMDGQVKFVLSGLLKTMDIFLAALVMMLLAVGLYDVFVLAVEPGGEGGVCEGWSGFDTLDGLKNSLAKLIVVILIFTFLEIVLADVENMHGYMMLIVPAGVLFIAAGLKLLRN